jgi:hypothetical protein
LVIVGCSAPEETTAVQREPLLCKSVDVCDDGNPCTDDLCIANLCVNEPLLNCQLGGEGGGGAGSDDSGATSGRGGTVSGLGGSGNHAGSSNKAGTNAGGSGTSGSGGHGQEATAGADGELSATAGAAANETDADKGGNQAGAGGASAADAGAATAAAATQWTMQGGGCALGHTTPGFPLAMGGLLVLGLLSRARRGRGARS